MSAYCSGPLDIISTGEELGRLEQVGKTLLFQCREMKEVIAVTFRAVV